MFTFAAVSSVSQLHRNRPGPVRRPVGAVALAWALVTFAVLAAPNASRAGQAEVDATYKDVQQTLGGVPSFLHRVAKAALPSAWSEVKALQLSDDTALPPKVKALISLAVAAQIPTRFRMSARGR